MNKRLLTLVRALPKVRALVVGDLVADHYLYGQTERISREAPVLIVRHEREEVQLGGGANAAHNASALGASVTVVGALGDDPAGRALTKQMKERGMSIGAVRSRTIATETKTRVLAGGISTRRQQMLRIDRGQTGPFPGAVRRALAKAVKDQLAKADVVLVSDYGAGVLDDETRRELFAHRERGGLVCVDSRYALATFTGASVLKPNEPELAALTGLPVSTDAQVLEAGTAALALMPVDTVLVTRGRQGMALFERDRGPMLIAPHGSEEAVDVTGAGDTVLATFSLALAAGGRAREAAQLANVAASLVVQKPGTATISAAELMAAL